MQHDCNEQGRIDSTPQTGVYLFLRSVGARTRLYTHNGSEASSFESMSNEFYDESVLFPASSANEASVTAPVVGPTDPGKFLPAHFK